ncbi:hypothetical protein BDD12DRAFT_901206 [Trichophaea hybrida]|nr:hypothetical protein BDD12DRAFT_901206 [Trichophaea hybrida]
MPRTLPWLADPPATTHAVPNPTHREIFKIASRKCRRVAPVDILGCDDALNTRLMALDDDRWVMVEDEFLSTAQLFTRYVHRKEYERLRLEATSKNASLIISIQQSVTGTSIVSQETLQSREVIAKEVSRFISSNIDANKHEYPLRPVGPHPSVSQVTYVRKRDLSPQFHITKQTYLS